MKDVVRYDFCKYKNLIQVINVNKTDFNIKFLIMRLIYIDFYIQNIFSVLLKNSFLIFFLNFILIN